MNLNVLSVPSSRNTFYCLKGPKETIICTKDEFGGLFRAVTRHNTRYNDPLSLHYANMSVQYIAIFHGCKNGIRQAVLTSTHDLCFRAKIRKKCIPV